MNYCCEDCGWLWPQSSEPPMGAECDNCGGELLATDDPKAMTTQVARTPGAPLTAGYWLARRGAEVAGRKVTHHEFALSGCLHWRCTEAAGWQCAECGHYFPREAVRMDPDSEVRCRAGMGHERRGAYGH